MQERVRREEERIKRHWQELETRESEISNALQKNPGVEATEKNSSSFTRNRRTI